MSLRTFTRRELCGNVQAKAAHHKYFLDALTVLRSFGLKRRRHVGAFTRISSTELLLASESSFLEGRLEDEHVTNFYAMLRGAGDNSERWPAVTMTMLCVSVRRQTQGRPHRQQHKTRTMHSDANDVRGFFRLRETAKSHSQGTTQDSVSVRGNLEPLCGSVNADKLTKVSKIK